MSAFLILGNSYALFEPSNNLSDIFFDRANNKICTVRNAGSLGITARGFKKDDVINFRVQATRQINTVSFSPDMKIAGVHRDEKSIDFVFLDQKLSDESHPLANQLCKTKNSSIITFEWINDKQVLYITDAAIELYQINPKKRNLKFMKSCNASSVWTIYYPQSQLLICASGITNAFINLFIIQNGIIHKLPRFEVDFGCSKVKPKLNDKDVMIASVYQVLYFLVVKVDSEGMIRQINMYEIPSDVSKPLQLAHILLLHVDDNIGMHVIDNLVIVHHRTTAKSYIFDIKVSETSTTDHSPILESPIDVVEELSASYGTATTFDSYPWFILSPNIVVDARFGIFGDLQLQLKNASIFIKDRVKFLRFIMNRTKVEEYMLAVIRDEILSKSLSLFKIADIFREIYDPCEKKAPIEVLQRYDNSKCKLIPESYSSMKADQSHILTYVFEPLGREINVDKKWLSNVLLEFMLILKQHKSLVHNYLPELLIMVMSEAKEYSRLQQILQHRVIDDSKFLAFRLIEISKTYPPFFQLAIDMLARRGNNEQILTLLLERGQVIDAVKCIKDPTIVDQTLCLKILDIAWKSDNRQIKYTIYSYFHDILKLAFMDSTSEQFEKYSKDFKALFDTEEIEEAEDRFRLARISSTPASINALLTHEGSFEAHSFSSFRDIT